MLFQFHNVYNTARNACYVYGAVACINFSLESYALDKIRNSNYMESVYKFSTEEETKLMVLAHAYAGEEKSEDDGNFYPQHPHEGFLVWLRDYNYLVSDLFFENNSDNDSDKSDLTLWWKSTLHAGLFLGEWSSEDREIAIEKVKNMEDTYLRWLQNQKANNKCPPRSQNLLANLLKQISSVEIEY